MFGSHILDVGIGLTLFFLFVSLICSAAREAVETILKSRARDLERGMRTLLDDPTGTGLTTSVFQHGQIASLLSGEYDAGKLKENRSGVVDFPWGGSRKVLPSYIPAEQFATALMDVVAAGASNGDALSLDTLRAGAAQLPSARVRQAVTSALDHAAGDLALARRNLESWFDGSMDRVSGWYKRRTQIWLFVIGLVAAVLLNLDALAVVNRLQLDDTFRQAVVANAQAVVDNGSTKVTAESPDQARSDLAKAGFPVGWRRTSKGTFPWALPTQMCNDQNPAVDCELPAGRPVSGGIAFILVVIGWIITAGAATFGAPFWFDLLNKFMIVRSTVKPRQKSPDEASPETKAPPPNAPAGVAVGVSPPPPPPPSAPSVQPAVPAEPQPSEAVDTGEPASANGESEDDAQAQTWREGFVNTGEVKL